VVRVVVVDSRWQFQDDLNPPLVEEQSFSRVLTNSDVGFSGPMLTFPFGSKVQVPIKSVMARKNAASTDELPLSPLEDAPPSPFVSSKGSTASFCGR
jgi:hypothetical protein